MSQAPIGKPSADTGELDLETPSGATEPMGAAQAPNDPGTISAVGIVLALLLTALGVVAVRDALVAGDVLAGTPWLQAAITPLDGLQPAGWVLPVGLVLFALGWWLLLAALRPRPRTIFAVQAQTGVFVRPRDVQRLAVTAAEHVDGVLSAKASVTRRKVTVTATTTGDERTGDQVRLAVRDGLAPLASPPAAQTRTIVEGRDR